LLQAVLVVEVTMPVAIMGQVVLVLVDIKRRLVLRSLVEVQVLQ
jgi:hypothetical protein